MKCLACEFENPPQMKFCGNCGQPLDRLCPGCGFPNPPAFRFCGQCGLGLEEPTPGAPSQAVAQSTPAEAERRLLTVLFCDLVASTALAERLGAEDFRDALRRYQRVATEVFHRFSGHIAQYLGDGLMVYFGYPRAREGDARRAIRAGLEMLHAISRIKEEVQEKWGVELAVRIGAHTGTVVAGEVGAAGRTSSLALGSTPNIAARLTSLAEPNSVVMSGATFDLVQGFFECQALGARQLKGIAKPVPVLRALQETGARSSFEIAVARGLTPFVGRNEELATLLARFAEVKQGRGQVILITGEAGIGKSRLQQRFREDVSKDIAAWLTCRCAEEHRNSAFSPIIDLLQRTLDFRRDEPPEPKLKALEGMLESLGFGLSETLPLLATLLGLPLPPDARAPRLSPQRQKEKTMEAVLALLVRMAARRPVILAVEDLHWADPSTLELLELLLEGIPSWRVLTLLTARAEFEPAWASRPHLSAVALERLGEKETQAIVEGISGGTSLAPEVLEKIVERTDGVPIFVEELTKMILDSELLEKVNGEYTLLGELAPHAIPSTLQGSLTARLDRLAESKTVAQLGAVLGRSFSYDLLESVSPLDPEALNHHLGLLVEAELLDRHGRMPQTTYSFRHALIRDVAYQSLLKSKRREVHAQVAEVIEADFKDMAQLQPELLGYHFEAAQRWPEAVGYLAAAGERAVGGSAFVEGIRHLRQALHLLDHLEIAADRQRRELHLLMVLGVGLMATQGYAAPDVEANYNRAWELCNKLGDSPLPVLYGIWGFNFVRGERAATDELADSFAQLLRDAGSKVDELVCHTVLGTRACVIGELKTANDHLKTALDLYDPSMHDTLVRNFGDNLGIYALLYSALRDWYAGLPDRAWKRQQAALAEAEAASNPLALATALTFGISHAKLRRDPELAWTLGRRCIQVSREQGMPYWGALGKCGCGWSLAHREPERGIDLIQDGLSSWEQTGARLPRAFWLAFLIDALMGANRITEGLERVAEAVAWTERYLEGMFDGELQRLKGELLLRGGADDDVVERCFVDSLELVRNQGARSFELRTAMSLSRLWQRQERSAEARELLVGIYGSFEEGFDTQDLREARELLAELSGEPHDMGATPDPLPSRSDPSPDSPSGALPTSTQSAGR